MRSHRTLAVFERIIKTMEVWGLDTSIISRMSHTPPVATGNRKFAQIVKRGIVRVHGVGLSRVFLVILSDTIVEKCAACRS